MARTTSSLRCLRCQYELVGLPQRVCPECGVEFDPKTIQQQREFVRGLWRRSYFPGALLFAYAASISLVFMILPQLALILAMPMIVATMRVLVATDPGGTSTSTIFFVIPLFMALNLLFLHVGLRQALRQVAISNGTIWKMRITTLIASAIGGSAVVTIGWLGVAAVASV